MHDADQEQNALLEDMAPSGRVRSGKARMNKLSPEARKDLGRRGALARWAQNNALAKAEVLETEHGATISIGETEVACAVLPDGTRVVSERGLVKAFGGKRGGSHWRRIKADPDGAHLPVILSANNLRPFIDEDLRNSLKTRILYRVKGSGAKPAYGVKAELFPRICNVFLKARDADKLLPQQKEMSIAADILMRALAHVAIVALIDEATGYEDIRGRKALQEILDQYIGAELAKWAKRFPDEFYKEMFRLRGWNYDPNSSKRPIQMAQITVDLVYDRIGPGLTDELRRKKQEEIETTGKKAKLHQWLTDDLGHPALKHHLSGLIFLGKSFDDKDWEGFYRAVNRVAPRRNQTLYLPFPEAATA